MSLSIIIDAALVVLIWMVQLLIYPGFLYFEKEKLIQWHHRYTRNMGFIVAPLMMIQLVLHAVQIYSYFQWIQILIFVFIVLLWILTFLVFVPIHNRISKDSFELKDLKNLTQFNWYRTTLWTMVFLLSLISKYQA